jgi:hypothetical protein
MTRYLPLLLLVLSMNWVSAQTIENVRSTFQNNKITITFDIVNAKAGQEFNVQVYSSHNGFATPLTYLSGDVGHSVKPGVSKKVEWDVQGELKNFTGDITLDVRAEIVLAWLFLQPKSGTGSVRRGKDFDIRWQGGSASDNVKLEYIFEGKTTLIGEAKNTGTFTWNVPSDLPKGKGYELRLTSGGRSTTENFLVKSKLPLLVKVGPVVVAGALAYLLLRPTPEEPLPTPPNIDAQ